MGTPISAHALGALLLAVAVFAGYASGRARVEIISLLTIGAIALGLYVFPLPGTESKDGLVLAFEGFGHQALVTICALMILGRGLVVTGALDPAARLLGSVWRVNGRLGLLVTLLLALSISMVMNDTPVLVLLLPILVQLGNSTGMPASKTLIPVNSAILIGGMATTIGTSTNLLVVSIATDLGLPPLGVFHYTELVLMAALVALPYLWLVMPKLLPDNSAAAGHQARRFWATLRLTPESGAVGRRVADLRRSLPPDARIEAPDSHVLSADQRVQISAPQDQLAEALRKLGGSAAPFWLVRRLKRQADEAGDDLVEVEMAVAPDSRLIGLTLQTAGIAGVAVMGVHQARRFMAEDRVEGAQAPLREGDVLLVMGRMGELQDFAARDGLLVLEGGKDMPRSAKAPLALAIMGGAVLLASFGVVPIAISALGGAVLMFITGCVRFERVGRALSAQVIVLVASSIALGKLILVSGAAGWLGEQLASGLQHLPPAAVLASIMLFVTLLTNFASNNSAAAVGTPIAWSLAGTLGLPPEPMILAVLFGCNLCYATPVAYQTNMMIMAEGDYRFGDYMRTGLPLVAIMITSLSVLLVLRYDL